MLSGWRALRQCYNALWGCLLNVDLVTFIGEPALWPTWLWGFGGEDNADDRKAKISIRVNE